MTEDAGQLRGQKGDTGAQGKRGEPGMGRRPRRAVVYLFLLNSALIVAGFLWLGHTVTVNAQQRCGSILADARIPLPHPIAGNPSREWEAAFEAIEQHRAAQLGCGNGH